MIKYSVAHTGCLREGFKKKIVELGGGEVWIFH